MPTTFELSRCTFIPAKIDFREDMRNKRMLCWVDGILTPTNGESRAVKLTFHIRMSDYHRCRGAAKLDQLVARELDEAATLYLEAEAPTAIETKVPIPIEWKP